MNENIQPNTGYADFAMAQARAVSASIGAPANAAYTTQVVLPGNLVAPSTVTLAAVSVLPKASRLFVVVGSLLFTASAPDTDFSVGVQALTGAAVTATGGSATNTTGGLIYETAGFPIVIGGAPTVRVCGGGGVQVAAGSLIKTLSLSCLIQLPASVASVVTVGVTSLGGVNYSAFGLSFGIYELN